MGEFSHLIIPQLSTSTGANRLSDTSTLLICKTELDFKNLTSVNWSQVTFSKYLFVTIYNKEIE